MTFKEAIDLKNSISTNIVIKDGVMIRIMVTPKKHKDLLKYIEAVRGYFPKLTDEGAMAFSSNNQFTVHELWCDTANIIFKPINISGKRNTNSGT